MIRTQVRCDKRVSFRDRREGWTCVCPSPGVARTHVATRTESLEPGTLGKHGPGPRHRPYEVAGAKKHQHRLQPRRLSPGVQGHSIKLRQLTNGQPPPTALGSCSQKISRGPIELADACARADSEFGRLQAAGWPNFWRKGCGLGPRP